MTGKGPARVTATDGSNAVGFYDLNEPPFSASSGDRFVCQTSAQMRLADRVVDAVGRRDGLVVVTGATGVGKTVACRAILERLPPTARTSVIVDPFLTIEDFLQQILGDLTDTPGHAPRAQASDSRSRHDLVMALRQRLLSKDGGLLAVVVIDDAHLLGPELMAWIRVLSNLETNGLKQVQVVLVGQPRLEALMRREESGGLDERVSCRCHLGPLTPGEVGPYVEHRMSIASGEQGAAVQFANPAIRALCVISGRVPRLVNVIAAGALELGAERNARHIGRSLVLESAVAADIPIPVGERIRGASTQLLVAAAIVVVLAGALQFWPARQLLPIRAEETRPSSTQAEVPPRAMAALPAASDSSVAAPAAGERGRVAVAVPDAVLPVVALPGVAVPGVAVSGAVAPEAVLPGVTLQSAAAHLVVSASFKQAKNAAGFAGTLVAGGLPAFVREDVTSGWHVVLIGPYATTDETRDVQTQLATQFSVRDSRVLIQQP